MPTFRVGMTRSIQYLIVYLIIYLNKNWRKCSVVNFVLCLIWSSQRISFFFFLHFAVWDEILCIENIAPGIDGHAFDVCTVLWLFPSHLFSSHTKKKKNQNTSPQNNMPFHSLSPFAKISWFPVSDKLGETLITLISQKSEDFLFQIKLWHLLHKMKSES